VKAVYAGAIMVSERGVRNAHPEASGYRFQGFSGDGPGGDYGGGSAMADDERDLQGEAEPLNWACTNCGYRSEGKLPEKCPDCGADKEMFDQVPKPGM
jgi:rubredoxin